MLPAIDQYIEGLGEDNKSFVQALIAIIFKQDEHLHLKCSFGLPFFYFKGNPFCYINIDQKTKQPYLGFMNGKWLQHKNLHAEGRKMVKLLRFNNQNDIPLKMLQAVIAEALQLFYSGKIKIKKQI